MKTPRWNSINPLYLGLAAAVVLLAGCLTPADVLTYHNDNGRTGLNATETVLGWSNVKPGEFRKLFEQGVDGCVYAQPLYKHQVRLTRDGTLHNVVFVATAKNIVYAFDANNNTGANASALWTNNLNDGDSPVLPTDVGETGETSAAGCANITPFIGIIGTPVIGVSVLEPGRIERKGPVGRMETFFAVTKTREVQPGGKVDFIQRLHALDLTSGDELPGSPVEIARTTYPDTGTGITTEPGTYVTGPVVTGSGEGQGPSAGQVFFNALREDQRAGLVLTRGVVYVTWTSHCDCTPSHGWVVGFDANTLKVVSVFNTTPNATSEGWPNPPVTPPSRLADGGIWQSGAAPAADANGALYLATGNGFFETPATANGFPGLSDFGDTVLKLVPDTSTAANPNGNGWGQKAADFFTPFDQSNLELNDLDLGAGGVLLLPAQYGAFPNLAVQGGKNGTIYLHNRDNLGRYNAGGDHVVQSLPAAFGTQTKNGATVNNGVIGLPAYFNSRLYFIGQSSGLTSYEMVNGYMIRTINSGATLFSRGATPSISSYYNQNGIIWALQTDGYYRQSNLILHAYRADNAAELYNSEMAVGHADRPAGYGIEYTVPTVAGGKVYVGTSSTLAVYGIFSRLHQPQQDEESVTNRTLNP